MAKQLESAAQKSKSMPKLTGLTEIPSTAECRHSIEKQKELDRDLTFSVSGNYSEIERLLKLGANPNATDSIGQTPLMFAATNGYHKICKILIDYGADINAFSNSGSNVMMHAVFGGGHIQTIKVLLEAGASPNKRSEKASVPLIHTVLSNQKEICELLLEYGADPNAKDNDETTPLMFAAERGNMEICKLLIEKGADINAKNKNGWTASALAEKANHKETAVFLGLYSILGKGQDLFLERFNGCLKE